MPSTRVQVLPQVVVNESGPDTVVGGELRLATLAGGDTLLKPTPQPASLHVFGRYLTQVRQATEPFVEFAQLRGRAGLSGGIPRFSVRSPGEFRLLQRDESGPLLRLTYGLPHFISPARGGQRGNFLRLPPPPVGGNFFELAVELRVAGQVEGSHTTADVLDLVTLPLLNQKQLKVRFLDAQRDPIADARCRVVLGDQITSSSTSSTGELLHMVPRDTEEVRVEFDKLSVLLIVKQLAPTSENPGARTRLHNLGIADLDEVEGGQLDTEELALTRFQELRGLELTGRLDGPTVSALEEQNV